MSIERENMKGKTHKHKGKKGEEHSTERKENTKWRTKGKHIVQNERKCPSKRHGK
jgi:hypothetical protein